MSCIALILLTAWPTSAADSPPDTLAELQPGETFELGGVRFVMMPPLDCSGLDGLDEQACRLSEAGLPTADALVAAGEKALPALARVLASDDVRAPKAQAAHVLQRIGPAAIPTLVGAVAASPQREVREALVALGKPALDALTGRLAGASDAKARSNLMRAVAGFGSAAVPALRARLQAGGTDAFSAVLAASWLPDDALTALEPDLLAHYRATTSNLDRGEVLRAFADIGSEGARRVLAEALSDPDPRVRSAAGLALTRLDPALADAALQDALVAALSDPESASSATLAVQRLGRHDEAEREALRAAAASEDVRLAAYAAAALAVASDADEAATLAHLRSLVARAGQRDRPAIARAFGAFGPRAVDAVPLLADELRDGDPETARAASRALAAIGPAGIAVLDEVLQPGHPRAELAAEGLDQLDGRHPEAVALLRRALTLPGTPSLDAMNAVLEVEPVDPSVVRVLIEGLDGSRAASVASVLGDLGAPAAIPAVPALARHLEPDPRVAWQAARALARIGTPEANAALRAAAKGDGATAERVQAGWAWGLKELAEAAE